MGCSKVCGIISYFPDEEELRNVRTERCFDLLSKLNEHFKLPIILVAQNWKDEDINTLNQFKNQQIEVHTSGKLGIIGARMALRKIFLEKDYDYIILLDDDSELTIGEGAVEHYLKEIDDHPNMLCRWRLGFPRLMAVSRKAYEQLSYDFIKDYDPEKGEIFEDHCWHRVFITMWPDEVYDISQYNMKETSLYSEHDPNSVFYHKWVNDSGMEKKLRNVQMTVNSQRVIDAWVKELRKGTIKCSIIIPAYNASGWVTRCLDSIPSRDDLEVVVIDDCSTDNTLAILHEYNNRWGNYKVLHQETNRGPGEARQRGIEESCGERVYFADSDDWFYEEGLNKAIDFLYSSDCDKVDMIAGYHTTNSNKNPQPHVFRYSINNVFIKRSIMNGFKYPSGYFSEDCVAYENLMRLNNGNVSQGRINLLIWHYNIPREGSLTDIRHKIDRPTVFKVNDYSVNFEDLVEKIK